MQAIRLLRDSEEFARTANDLLAAHPRSFLTEVEYDVFPLTLVWMADDDDSGCLTIAQAQTGMQAVTYLSRGPRIAEGCVNVLEGLSEIADVATLLAHHPERPLSFTVHLGDNGLLSAARLTFANVYFKGDWRERASGGEGR